jgi:hypothetical protein
VFRDERLARIHVEELEREALERARIASLLAGSQSAPRQPGPLRSAGAAGARWLGRNALALADRLEGCRQRNLERLTFPQRIAAR